MDDVEQKLRKLLRLGLHPSTGPDEAAEALHRAKDIAQRHHLDLTRLLDLASAASESPSASYASPDAQASSYLGRMTRILDRATTLAQQLTATEALATADPQLFYDPAWVSGLQQVVDGMDMVAPEIRAVTAPESLLHIHVLYMRIAVAYQIRVRDLRIVIACLGRLDLGAASVAFGDVARVSELLAVLGSELEVALARTA